MPLAEQAAHMAFDAYRAKLPDYDPQVQWKDPDHADISFRVKGITLTGAVAIEPGVIDLDLDVPFLFRIFQKRAIDVIEREVNDWLRMAKAGDLGERTA